MKLRGLWRMVIVSGVCVVVGVLASCYEPYYPTAEPSKVEDGRNGTYTVTEKDNGALVYLNVGQRLHVELPANPTTGYLWTLGQDQPAIMNPLGEPVYRPTEDKNADGTLVGSGGNSTWILLAQRTGITNIRFTYHRPWEKDEKPAKTYRITVHVVKDKTSNYPLQRLDEDDPALRGDAKEQPAAEKMNAENDGLMSENAANQ